MVSSIKTPCINLCKLKDGTCIGCGRSIEQITNWSKYSPETREKIIKELDTASH